jgi:uncharacterized RDD family membrane protein YckC
VPPPPPPTNAPPPPPGPPPTRGDDAELAALLARIAEDGDADVAAPAVGTALTKPTDVSRPSRPAAPTVESSGGIAFDPEYASFGARAVGLAVDAAMLALFTAPGIVLVALASTVTVLLGILTIVVGFVAATVLYARAVARTGRSVGNRVAGTSVVDVRNGAPLDVGAAATRYVVRFLVSIILFGGFLVAFGNAERRTFHDRFAGSIVVRPPRASWSIDDEPPAGPTT